MQIQEVRKLKNAFAFTPFVAARKITIIDNAQTIRNEAANALLKLLEEPKGDALFFLVARSRSDVLATISSRAVEIRFLPRKMTIAERYGNAAILTATRAIKMFEAKTLDQRFGEARNYTVQNKDELIRILDIWLLNLRESLLTNTSKHTRELLSQILNAKQCIATTNTNPQLVMEELLLKAF
jgi:DNA polymerase III delta prime subunit